MVAHKNTYLILLSLLLTVKGNSQACWENYELFNSRSGLPNNAVLSMVQDDRNLLWIGTRNGLCVYDGHEFEIKKDIFESKEGEWANIFCTLFKDRDGNLWMGTQTGRVILYNVWRDSIVSYRVTGIGRGEFILSFFQDGRGKLLAGSNEGNLYAVQYKEKTLVRLDSVGESVFLMEGMGPGTVRINEFRNIHLPYVSGSAERKGCPIRYITRYKDRFDIHTNRGSISVSENEILGKRYIVRHISCSGTLLIATSRLIKEFDSTGKLLNRIVINDDPDNNSEDVANFIFEDASGMIWLGTNFGLIKIDRDKYRFARFGTNSTYGKLNSNYVRAVFEDRNRNVWVGFKAGYVNRLVPDTPFRKFHSTTCLYRDPQKSAVAINTIRQLRSGKMLFGGAEGLFYTTLKGSCEAKPVLCNYTLKDSANGDVSLTEVWSVFEDKYGKIWVGTRCSGLFVVDPLSHKYRRYLYTPNKDSAGLMSVWQIFEDSRGSIWLATENGLDSVIVNANGYPGGFYNLSEHYKGEAGTRVWSVTEDGDHNLWIGTTDNGFSMVNKKTRAFTTYNQHNGLQGNVVCGVLPDNDGYLWVSTMNGISRFDTRNHTFTHYTENDGLAGNDYNFNASYKASSGQLFFGSKSGMVAFYPGAIHRRVSSAKVLVRAVNLLNKKYIENPGSGKPIILQHNQNSFSFKLAIPDYASPSAHQFKYMLVGFDKQWITTDARHPLAVYTNIPPGEYIFCVKGSVGAQEWNSEFTTLIISIRPAFWQKPLFVVAAVVFSVLLIAGLIYLRFRRSMVREREKHRINQKFAELELRALQAQMNPHFIFNSINAIQHFMLTSNELTANAYLTKFARLMRLYFESSMKKYVLVAEEVELLKLYVNLEKLRFEDKFDYAFFVDARFEDTAYVIPSMLLQPHVENAINHGLAKRKTKGWLNISFVKTATGVLCTIDDNGVGRGNTGKRISGKDGRPKSSDTIHERLNAYRQVDNIEVTISIIDKKDGLGNNAGTKVELEIPQLN